jgi:ribosomal protein S3
LDYTKNKNDTKKTRIKGNYMKYLLKELGSNSKYIQDIVIERPDKLTPVLIHNNRYATIIGPNNPKVYRKLITRHDNLRISVRDIKEGDLD